MRASALPYASAVDDPSDDRLVILNLRTVSRAHLFASARSLIGSEEPRGPALVVAQTAVEVGFETAIDFAMKMRLTYDPLREWVVSVPVRSWSPNNHKRAQAVGCADRRRDRRPGVEL